MRRFLLVLIVLVLALVLVPAPSGAASPVYVALGDSYTSGPFIGYQIGTPVGCLRSDRNYPRRLGRALHMSLRDASCTGATTSKLTRSQGVIGGTNAAQMSRLSSDTTLVTLQMGGNDIGFTEILLRCATLLPFGTPCQSHYVHNGVDAIANRISALSPRIETAIDDIHDRAPHARVLVLGYPAIFPDAGRGCWPSLPFAGDDVPYLRARAKQLNAMIAAAAAHHGATYVNVYTPSIGHDACADRSVRWVEPFVPATAAAPLHPNDAGMNAITWIIRSVGRL